MGAEEYAQQIKKVLESFDFFTDDHLPQVRIYGEGQALFWEDRFTLTDGATLEVRESIQYKGNLPNKKNYRFSLRTGSGVLVFLFDTHGTHQDVNEPGHVHHVLNGSEQRVPIDHTVGEMNFLALMHCVKNHCLNKPQKWEGTHE